MKVFRIVLLFSLFILSLTDVQAQELASEEKAQTPIPPFEYKVEQVTFQNEIDSVLLSGTLSLPKQGKKHPAVILLSGSGAQDRNGEILGHKPFLVIADYLTNRGIAVLRVDDRGAGESEGDYNETGLAGFNRDALAAFEFLKKQKSIDESKIGFMGHSLGGLIALMAYHELGSSVDFLVLLGTSGLRGDKLMLLQKAEMERGSGFDEMSILKGQNDIGGAYLLMRDNDAPRDSLRVQLADYFVGVYGTTIPKFQLDMLTDQLTYPWLRGFIQTDPKPLLQQVNCPILALGGSNDLQVPPKPNLSAIESAIASNGNKDVTIKELLGLNHLFQESKTGMPQEYASNEQTFSPDALQIIGDWILSHSH